MGCACGNARDDGEDSTCSPRFGPRARRIDSASSADGRRRAMVGAQARPIAMQRAPLKQLAPWEPCRGSRAERSDAECRSTRSSTVTAARHRESVIDRGSPPCGSRPIEQRVAVRWSGGDDGGGLTSPRSIADDCRRVSPSPRRSSWMHPARHRCGRRGGRVRLVSLAVCEARCAVVNAMRSACADRSDRADGRAVLKPMQRKSYRCMSWPLRSRLKRKTAPQLVRDYARDTVQQQR